MSYNISMAEQSLNHFSRIAQVFLYLFAVLFPIWFLPLPVSIEFGRAVTFGVLIFLATLFWFLGILTSGQVKIQYSPVFILMLFMAVIFGVGALISRAPMSSLLFVEPLAERYISLAEGILLMILAGSVVGSKKSAERLGIVMLISGGIAGMLHAAGLLTQIPLLAKLNPAAADINFNVVGSMSASAIFYAVLLGASLGFLTGGAESKWKKCVFSACAFVFLLNLFLINNFNAWLVLLIVSIFIVGINFRSARDRAYRFNWRYALGALFTALAIVMIMIRAPILSRVKTPAEVSPSLGATIAIAKSVFRENTQALLFGSGPGTFGMKWLKYKDSSINQTQFWASRFNQGSAWLSTLFVTSGVLGFFSFALFLIISLVIFLRGMLLARGEERSRGVAGFFLGFMGFAAAAFLYPVNITFLLGLFFAGGLVLHQLSFRPHEALGEGNTSDLPAERARASFWDIREKAISFEGPWMMFFSSLITIFALVLSVGALYFHYAEVRAALLVQSGVAAFNKGEADRGVGLLTQALQTAEHSETYSLLMQMRIESVRKLIERAARGENVQQEFQQTVFSAAQEFQRVAAIQADDPDVWRAQGAFYELLIPFIDGSERLTFESYEKAGTLDPLNPSIPTDLGRAHLVHADRLLAIINKGAPDRDKQIKEREEALKGAVLAFERAIDVKPDFASAHFLHAQASLRLGNIEKAVKSVEEAKRSAPFDIGIAFQLGLLYYQTGDLERAAGEFDRAISINDNYSNARYFLGLIHDRRGDKANALRQFEKIEQLNLDNQEVKKIIANLRTGKPALDGIAPPGEAPEKRREVPLPAKNSGKK